jgi:uncharacterized membrane protein
MSKRLVGIDVFRTLAIIIMIIANSAPYLENKPIPYGIRLICSIAAPIFIFLSGFVFSQTIKEGDLNLSKWKNSIYLIITGALIDLMVWRIKPFNTFDILYLIGISQLINLAIRNFSITVKCVIWIIIVVFSFSYKNEYRFINDDLLLVNSLNAEHVIEFKRLFLDGWFPLFPWFTYSLLGSILGEFLKKERLIKFPNLLISLMLCISGLIYLITNPIIQEYRDDYVELFYPVKIPYFIFSISLAFVGTNILLKINQLPNYLSKLIILGEHSLFVYLIHTIIISYIIKPITTSSIEINHLFIYLIFILSLYAAVYFLKHLLKKDHLNFIPTGIRQILGIR